MSSNNTIGIIFKNNNDIYNFLAICKVDIQSSEIMDMQNDSIGTLKDFDLFDGNPEFIFDVSLSLKLCISNDKKSEYALYILDPEYISGLCERENMCLDNVIKYIKLRASELALVHKNKTKDEYTVFSHIKNKIEKTDDDNKFNDEDEDNISLEQALEYYKDYKNEKIQNQLPFIAILLNEYENNEEEEFTEEEYEKLTESPSKKIKKMDIKKVISDICKKIVGQDEAIKTLVANICFIQELIDYLEETDEDISNELDSRKPAILLDGSTGTGKTAIAKEIAHIFDLPLVIVNANSFSETGYVGPTITDILEKLLKEAKGDLELASRGIVVIDEVDKIAETDTQSRSMKLGVQKELLGFMSGSSYDIKQQIGPMAARKIEFDTSRLTFILSGAFTDIKEKKIKENEKNSLGFNSNTNKKEKKYTITSQDYIDFGLMREFFGRIKVITTTKTYSIDDLKRILLESVISPLKGFEKTCKMYGYPGITYSEEFLDTVADKAYEMGTGARALQNLLSGIQDIMLYDLITGSLDKSKPVELTTELLNKYQKRNIRKY